MFLNKNKAVLHYWRLPPNLFPLHTCIGGGDFGETEIQVLEIKSKDTTVGEIYIKVLLTHLPQKGVKEVWKVRWLGGEYV